jgi:predicted phosphodiesterase
MRLAVISDIHGNARALEAALGAIDADGVDAIWSLGDVVGYGPRPNECCAVAASRCSVALAGNHDLGVLGAIDLEEFSPDAAAAALWSREVLTPEARATLEPLAPLGRAEGFELFHASPRDPIWDYVLSVEAARESLELTTAPVVLVGHSHVPIAILATGGSLEGGLAKGGHTVSLELGRWLLNPGSIGQPRDGDPRAAYLVLDLDRGTGEFRRVEYDVAGTQAEIAEAGLPEVLAERLATGT